MKHETKRNFCGSICFFILFSPPIPSVRLNLVMNGRASASSLGQQQSQTPVPVTESLLWSDLMICVHQPPLSCLFFHSPHSLISFASRVALGEQTFSQGSRKQLQSASSRGWWWREKRAITQTREEKRERWNAWWRGDHFSSPAVFQLWVLF